MTVFSPIISAEPALPGVSASLEFLRPMAVRPVVYDIGPPRGIPAWNGVYDRHPVVIADARPFASGLSLDREGFILAHAPSEFADFGDEVAIRRHYYPEVERLLRRATGADLVVNFDHNIRNADRTAPVAGHLRRPVFRAHNDFTAGSGHGRVRRELEERGYRAEQLLGRRHAIVNVWRPIGNVVETTPLALADAGSIRPDDLIETDLVYRDRVGEIYELTHRASHRWHYFPRLAPEEAVLIKVFDSLEQGVARFTPHAAFEDAESPAGAPARESIEARAVVIFPD